MSTAPIWIVCGGAFVRTLLAWAGSPAKLRPALVPVRQQSGPRRPR
jgi:hypothetical protein